MDGHAFKKRLVVAIVLAYILPPVIGLSFLVFVIEMFSVEQLKELLTGSTLPFYIGGTTVGAVFYFLWFLRPVTRFADNECSSSEAIACMRRFSSHYWGLYVMRHLVGGVVVSLSAHSVLGFELSTESWIRMAALGIMLSCLAGLPVYAYVMDFFAATFRDQPLSEPIFRIRTRVVLVAVLVPVALNTAILQFLLSRLGGLTIELLLLWFSLLAFAVAAAYNLMRSLNRSVAELRQVSDQRKDTLDLRPHVLRVRSLDELGVLTCEYRELLGDLKQQARILDLHNQVLKASSHDVEPDLVYRGLLEIVTGLFQSERSRLVAMNDVANVMDVLAAKGEEMALTADGAPTELMEALCKLDPSFLPAKLFDGVLSPTTGMVAVVPLNETTSTNEQLAVIAVIEAASDVERCELATYEQIREEIAAAVRGTRLAKERTRLEKVLLESQRMELVGRLAAGVAHDFNNVLTVIVSAAGLLKLESQKPSVAGDLVEEYSQLIMESSQRASALTRQLLTFSRQHIGLVTVFELNVLVEALGAFLRRLVPEDIEYTVSLSPEVGRIRADKGHIEQVITNLVVNARDAMEDGGTLRLETAQEGDWVVLRVIDDGCGMEPEVLSHLFEPFFTTKPTEKGTGLGLATTYGIVKNYAGEIDVKSVPGEGTAMTVRLPLAHEESTSHVKEKVSTIDLSAGRVILLVEDEESVRRVLGDILSGQGYTVMPVTCGEDAITLLENKSNRVDLLLSDIVMPGMKGTEVARRTAELRPNTKILLMTGYADAKSLEAAKAQDFTIVTKPFAPEALLAKIESLLGKRRTRTTGGASPLADSVSASSTK